MGLSLIERQLPLSLGRIVEYYYLSPVAETILSWADGYDAEHRREVERIVRGDGFLNTQDAAEHVRALLQLISAVHLGAYAEGRSSLVIERAKQARLRKRARDCVEQYYVARAVQRVTYRLGNRKKRDYKLGDKLPVSDTYAEAIRDEVLKELGRPKDAKKPSLTGIRRAIKRTNDGRSFQTDQLKGFALKD
jgi:hypothetical protein